MKVGWRVEVSKVPVEESRAFKVRAVVRESDGHWAMAPGEPEHSASGRLTSLNIEFVRFSLGLFISGTDFKTELERPMNARLTRPTSFRCINRHRGRMLDC